MQIKQITDCSTNLFLLYLWKFVSLNLLVKMKNYESQQAASSNHTLTPANTHTHAHACIKSSTGPAVVCSTKPVQLLAISCF